MPIRHTHWRGRMLAGTALVAAVAGSALTFPAFAQETLQNDSLNAAQSTPQPPGKEATAPEDILVTARKRVAGGYMIEQRQPETTHSISSDAISEKMQIAGPLQIIANLPGVNAGQSDPYAMSQRSFAFVRGLPSNEIGWLVDGVPTVDQAFFLPYSETWVDPENLAGVTIIPGSSRITDPLQTAVGGEIIMTVREPSDDLGGSLVYARGDYKGQRFFGRLDTGEIAGTGVKAYASASYTEAGTFNLPGKGDRTHVDFRAEKEWSDTAKSTLFVSYTDWNSLRSNVITLDQFRTAQRTGDYTIGNYAPTYTPGVTSNYYKNFYYYRRSLIVSSNNSFELGDKLKVNVNPYYQWIHSNSPGQTSVNPASLYSGNTRVQIDTTGLTLVNGRLPAQSNSLQRMDHYGVNTFGTYDIADNNQLLVGWWHDHWKLGALNSLAPLNPDGTSQSKYGDNPLYATDGQIVSGLRYNMNTDINAFAIQDSLSFMDERLKIELGLRYFHQSLKGQNLVPGPQSEFAYRFGRWLPRATVSFDVNSEIQLYGDIVTTTRPPIPINTYPNTYNAATGAIAQVGVPDTKPEYAVGGEIGLRYHGGFLIGEVAYFQKRIRNRQVSANAVLNGAGISRSLSAGTQMIRGVTAELSTQPFHGFSPYINGQYLHSTTVSDFAINGDFLPTAGKTAPGSPKFTGNLGVLYSNAGFFANFLLKYQSSQYGDFMNFEKMPAYHVIDLGVGYRIPSIAGENITLKLNITNLENKAYLGSLIGTQPSARATTGINGTPVAGATPAYFLTSPRTIMGSISIDF